MWSTPIIEDVITSAVILALPTWLLIEEIVHCDANLRAASAKGPGPGAQATRGGCALAGCWHGGIDGGGGGGRVGGAGQRSSAGR
jgi:hypothetical protein